MDLADDVRSALFDAGAEAVLFNAPLSMERATALVETLSQHSPASIVDLGCGRGALARLVAARIPPATVIGIDSDERVIRDARERARAEALHDRLRFEVGDAATWAEPVDTAICIGASHAFGGSAELLAHLAQLVTTGPVLIGDGIWQATPDAWCRDAFGDLPAGPDALAALAQGAGWIVDEVDTSTLAEWDEFEQGWIEGVRSVGTPEAASFADQREREYGSYRGTLGFCWLILTR